ncbi:hypothetical protein MMPV_005929 [Pyropia vietnamensis]
MATSFVASAAAGSFVPGRAASAVCGHPRSLVLTTSTVGHRAASIIRMRVDDAASDTSLSANTEARAAGAEAGAGEEEPELSALDVFQSTYDKDEKEGGAGVGTNKLWTPAPADDGAYDEAAAVVSSGDAAVADEILAAVPTSGMPVTVLTGFLGSGKTTLLNWILTQEHGLKVAVLVNEFGSIDIDSQLVKAGDWSSDGDTLQLANGCICCSINEPFVAAVQKILDKEDQFDYLVIETSGVADPVPVLNSLMMGELEERVRIDGILTLVDTDNFDSKLFETSETAISQLLSADTILLSKTDMADPKSVEAATAFIRKVRPAARLLKSQRGRVPLHLILDTRMRMAGAAGAAQGKAEHASHEASNHDHAHDHDHSSHDHAHGEEGHTCDDSCDHDHDHSSHAHKPSNHLESDGFMSASFTSTVPLSADTFMNDFLQRLPRGVFRAKGLLCFDDYPQRYIFQLSGRRYQFEEDDWPEGSNKVSQLVVIGRDLDLDDMRSRLDSCRVGVAGDTDVVDAPAAASAA